VFLITFGNKEVISLTLKDLLTETPLSIERIPGDDFAGQIDLF
jgi:hypothetical protein